jgi:hypothetical protein
MPYADVTKRRTYHAGYMQHWRVRKAQQPSSRPRRHGHLHHCRRRPAGRRAHSAALPGRPHGPRRVGPGNFTPSSSQNRTGRSHVIRLVPPVEGYRLPLRTWGSSCCQLTRSQLGDRLPSLHGHYPASSLLRSRPPLSGASVLSASRGCRLRLFPWHRRSGSHVPDESPHESHASQGASRFCLHICGVKPTVCGKSRFNEQVRGGETNHALNTRARQFLHVSGRKPTQHSRLDSALV